MNKKSILLFGGLSMVNALVFTFNLIIMWSIEDGSKTYPIIEIMSKLIFSIYKFPFHYLINDINSDSVYFVFFGVNIIVLSLFIVLIPELINVCKNVLSYEKKRKKQY